MAAKKTKEELEAEAQIGRQVHADVDNANHRRLYSDSPTEKKEAEQDLKKLSGGK